MIKSVRAQVNKIKNNLDEAAFLVSENYRSFLERVARGVSGNYVIAVRFSQSVCTDGKTIFVNPLHEYMKGLTLAQKTLCVLGQVAHELFHILYTDFDTLIEISKEQRAFYLKRLLNIVEDSAIELAGTNYFIGKLRTAIIYFNKISFKHLPALDSPEVLKIPKISQMDLTFAMYCIIGKLKGPVNPELLEYFQKAMPIIDKGRMGKTSWNRLEAARELLEIVEPLIEEAEKNEEEVGSSYPKNELVGKNSGKVQEWVPDEGEVEDFQESNRGKTKTRIEKQKKAIEDKDEEDTDKEKVNKEGIDENGGSNEELKEDDNQDDTQESGGSGKSDDDESNEEDDLGGSDELDGSDGSGKSDNKDLDESTGSDKLNELDEDGPDENGGSDRDPDESTDENSDSTAAGGSNKPGNNNKEDHNNKMQGQDEGGDEDEDEDEDEKVEAEREEELDSLEKQLEKIKEEEAEEIYNKEEQKKRDREILEFSKEVSYSDLHRNISVTSKKISGINQAGCYNLVSREFSSVTRNLTKKIQEVIKFNEDFKLSGQYRGKVNVSQLHRKDKRVFYENKEKSDEANLAILLLIDESGSMISCERIVHARDAAIVLYEACKKLEIPLAVIGHWAQENRPKVIMEHFVDFDSHDPNEKYSLCSISAYDNTREGVSLKYAGEFLKRRPEEDKILLVISDGAPYHSYDDLYGDVAERDAGVVVKQLEKEGIKVFGIAIGDGRSDIRKIYTKNFIDIKDINGLSVKLLELIKKNILK